MRGFSDSPQLPFDGPISKAEFCHWVERQNGKYEWKAGRIVQMTNTTRLHARIVMNIAFALRDRLDQDKWTVMADFGVERDDAIRYTDVLIEPVEADGKSRRSHNVAVIFEVLSPSSVARDFLEKREEYASFETLEAYVIVSQDEPICWLYERGADGKLMDKPLEISGREAALILAARGISLPLSDIYRGLHTV